MRQFQMCYSKEVSITTFLIGVSFSALLIFRGPTDDKIVGLFLAYISFMQAFEYLLWSNQKCDDVNKNISLTAMFFLHLEPVVLAAIALLLSPIQSTKPVILLLVAIYAFIAIPFTQQYLRAEPECTLRKEPDPHLFWPWTAKPKSLQMYVIFAGLLSIIPILSLRDKAYGYTTGFLAMFTFVVSGIVYKREFVGSMWCFFGSFVPALLYFLRARGTL
jgi:hypothetical protein